MACDKDITVNDAGGFSRLAARISRVQNPIDTTIRVGEIAGRARRSAPRSAALTTPRRAAGGATAVRAAEAGNTFGAAARLACSSPE